MKEKADSGFRFFIKETSTQLSGRPLGYKGGGGDVDGTQAGERRKKGTDGRGRLQTRGIIWWINTRKICHLKVINDCHTGSPPCDASKIL